MTAENRYNHSLSETGKPENRRNGVMMREDTTEPQSKMSSSIDDNSNVDEKSSSNAGINKTTNN